MRMTTKKGFSRLKTQWTRNGNFKGTTPYPILLARPFGCAWTPGSQGRLKVLIDCWRVQQEGTSATQFTRTKCCVGEATYNNNNNKDRCFSLGASRLSNVVPLKCPTWWQIFWVIQSKSYPCLLPSPPPAVPLMFWDFPLTAVSDYPYGMTRCRLREQPPLAGNFDKAQRVRVGWLWWVSGPVIGPLVFPPAQTDPPPSLDQVHFSDTGERRWEQRDSSVWGISSGEGGW